MQPVEVSWNPGAVSENGRGAAKAGKHLTPTKPAMVLVAATAAKCCLASPSSPIATILDLLGLFLRQQPERKRNLAGDHRQVMRAVFRRDWYSASTSHGM